MSAYLLRDIEAKFWKQVKARAAAEGRGLRWVVLRLLELYARHGLDALEERPKREPR
jgi:hypothetical protein